VTWLPCGGTIVLRRCRRFVQETPKPLPGGKGFEADCANRRRLTKWRRRESNEGAICPNAELHNDLEKQSLERAAVWECASDGDCHCLTSNGSPEYLVQAWPHLPRHIKETVFTLVEAALSRPQGV
jgi:hypothetical protein